MRVMNLSDLPLEKILQTAVGVLSAGGIVAYPTETFYALGVKFDLIDSIRRLYDAKQRPPEKALPLIIGDRALLSSLTPSVNRTALTLMEKFWPGPLTLVFEALDNLSEYLTAGSKTVAIRIPGESFALRLAASAGFPFTATSANISGNPPAEDAQTVIAHFHDTVDLVIGGVRTPGGAPSTIVDISVEPARIVREGAIKKENLAAYITAG